MGFKDVLQGMQERKRKQKELIKRMSDNLRFQKIVEDRMKSSNQRELERYLEEDRQEMIKERLEFARKKRSDDINFSHNPIDAENIMKAKWKVLREKSQFSGKSSLLNGGDSILQNNKKLLKSNNKLLKGGNMFKI